MLRWKKMKSIFFYLISYQRDNLCFLKTIFRTIMWLFISNKTYKESGSFISQIQAFQGLELYFD
jgi:hypothetical protein